MGWQNRKKYDIVVFLLKLLWSNHWYGLHINPVVYSKINDMIYEYLFKFSFRCRRFYKRSMRWSSSLLWRRNGRDGVSNYQPHHCLLKRSFRCRSEKTPKLHVTGLCAENSPVTSELPAQMVSNAENVSIWWRHNVLRILKSLDIFRQRLPRAKHRDFSYSFNIIRRKMHIMEHDMWKISGSWLKW